MKTATTAAAKTKTDTGLVEELNQVMADSYALMALTHLAHWNVEGPGFFQLHEAFEEQYKDLFEAVDEIAAMELPPAPVSKHDGCTPATCRLTCALSSRVCGSRLFRCPLCGPCSEDRMHVAFSRLLVFQTERR